MGLTSCTADQAVALRRILDAATGSPGPLIQVLHAVQGVVGYLPADVLDYVSEALFVPRSEVYGVATFYNFFRLDPAGKHTVTVCLGTACYVKGGAKILEKLKKELGVTEGRTTEDHLFTLDTARCFGACGLAPVITVDEEVYGRLSPTKALAILERYRSAVSERESQANAFEEKRAVERGRTKP
jgi:NADH-quinone oxidoreductase subunit E